MTDLQIDSAPAHHRPVRLTVWLFSGAVGLMLVCQFFFGLLQYSSLETKLRIGVLSTADTIAGTLADDLSMGLRLGKHLRNFYNLRNLLLDAHASFPMAYDICVTDEAGNLIEAVSATHRDQSFTSVDRSFLQTGSNLASRSAANGLYAVHKPLMGRDTVLLGHVLIRLQDSVLEERIKPAMMVLVRKSLLAMAVTVGASLLVICLVPFFTAQGLLIRRRIYISFGIVFAGVLLFSSALNHTAFRQEYYSIAMDTSRTMGQTMREIMHRTISKGVPVSLLKAVEDYFEAAAGKTSGAVLIELYRPDGVLAFSSRKAFLGKETIPGSSSDIGFRERASPEGSAPWILRTSLSKDAFASAVREDLLNSASLCIIALTMLFELLLLFCLLLEGRARAKPLDERSGSVDSERYGVVLRAVIFLFMLALDMSITFIPLRMAEIPTDLLGLPRDVVLGLPVSAEVAMAGVCILLAGRWISRYGAASVMSFGFLLAAVGYLASAVAFEPLGFILARVLSGAGYGTSIMAAQAYVYRSGGLASLFAGVFAGSLCGGAAGSLLAEKLGFSAAFYASSAMMLLLVALPYLLLRQGDTTRQGEAPRQSERTDFMRTLKALGNKQFLALSVFALMPATFIVMGFTKFFMPVYLSRLDVSQADIGRVYMVYCLVLIYLGPPLGRVVGRAQQKAPAVLAGCLLGALSILPLAIFDSLWPTVLCAFILGLANAVNIPAHGDYLLRLDITEQMGSNQALGLMNVVERLGQALAPIVIGLLMSAFFVRDIALWGGILLFTLSLAFYMSKVKE